MPKLLYLRISSDKFGIRIHPPWLLPFFPHSQKKEKERETGCVGNDVAHATPWKALPDNNLGPVNQILARSASREENHLHGRTTHMMGLVIFFPAYYKFTGKSFKCGQQQGYLTCTCRAAARSSSRWVIAGQITRRNEMSIAPPPLLYCV
jgi:hypothetical protein